MFFYVFDETFSEKVSVDYLQKAWLSETLKSKAFRVLGELCSPQMLKNLSVL